MREEIEKHLRAIAAHLGADKSEADTAWFLDRLNKASDATTSQLSESLVGGLSLDCIGVLATELSKQPLRRQPMAKANATDGNLAVDALKSDLDRIGEALSVQNPQPEEALDEIDTLINSLARLRKNVAAMRD